MRIRIATYNVNGVNGRLAVLLRWLKETQPDIVCLQELKAPQEKFPLKDIEKAGYGAIWHGQRAGTASLSLPRARRPGNGSNGREDRRSAVARPPVGLPTQCLQ